MPANGRQSWFRENTISDGFAQCLGVRTKSKADSKSAKNHEL